MKRYSCSILYSFNENNFLNFFSSALETLGFEPAYMTVYFDEFTNPLEDIRYDKNHVIKLLGKKPTTITLKNKIYDPDENTSGYCWFRFKLILDNPYKEEFCSLEWSNNSLDFLFRSKEFNYFLESKSLIYCYCYNQEDCMKQSNTSIINPEFEKPQAANSKQQEFILKDAINISEHWGRYIKALEFVFMAAPLMWFGEEYFKIIPQEKLLKFAGASLINFSTYNLVHVKLFDLYDDPEKTMNRQRQKEFWETFSLQNKAEQYKEERPIDFIAWYKERATTKKKRK